MKVSVVDMNGNEVGQVDLAADVFEANINRGLMHQAFVRQMANKRAGTHKAKGRSEINRTTAKAYRQKGTGRARHGSRRAPIFVGGGVAHGPQVRSYVKDMPRKMRQAALRSALSVKAQNGDIVVLNELSMAAPKTKEMVKVVNAVAGDSSALILLGERNENAHLSARNLADVKTIPAGYLNIRDLLGHDKLVMPMSALEAVTAHLGGSGKASAEEEE